jgi:cytochrome P450
LALTDARFSADRITPFRDHLAPDGAPAAELLKTLGLGVQRRPARAPRAPQQAFTPRAVMALRPLIERIVAHLISRVAGAPGAST